MNEQDKMRARAMSYSVQLNPDLDIDALRAAFDVNGRLRITDFLDPVSLPGLTKALEGLDWHLVMNDRDRHIDLPVSQLANIGLDRIGKGIQQALGRASDEFQYVYHNYPVADAYQSGRLKEEALKVVFEFMNTREVLDFIENVTGTTLDFCDMQATKYGPGHVLTAHTDGIPGKNRKLAYVLGLTEGWSAIWGGQLQFLEEDGGVAQSFVPAFNTLSIFAVPTDHHVTQVASFAPKSRVSLTGWMRTTN